MKINIFIALSFSLLFMFLGVSTNTNSIDERKKDNTEFSEVEEFTFKLLEQYYFNKDIVDWYIKGDLYDERFRGEKTVK